jgi:hypothetical protein
MNSTRHSIPIIYYPGSEHYDEDVDILFLLIPGPDSLLSILPVYVL